MPRPTLAALIFGALAAGAAGTSAAVNCYAVVDRNDNVVYRGTMPPIDLSDKGQPERDALRKRGDQLIAMDVDRCIGVEYFTGAAGTTALTVDQIVGGIQLRPGVTPTGFARPPSAGASAPASPPVATPPRASGMSGSGTRSSY